MLGATSNHGFAACRLVSRAIEEPRNLKEREDRMRVNDYLWRSARYSLLILIFIAVSGMTRAQNVAAGPPSTLALSSATAEIPSGGPKGALPQQAALPQQ